jgi:hypothetical protein
MNVLNELLESTSIRQSEKKEAVTILREHTQVCQGQTSETVMIGIYSVLSRVWTTVFRDFSSTIPREFLVTTLKPFTHIDCHLNISFDLHNPCIWNGIDKQAKN